MNKTHLFLEVGRSSSFRSHKTTSIGKHFRLVIFIRWSRKERVVPIKVLLLFNKSVNIAYSAVLKETLLTSPPNYTSKLIRLQDNRYRY